MVARDEREKQRRDFGESSEQTLDGEPTQHLGLDAVPKTGLRL